VPKKESRCWPGYEPVKGKKKNEQGSCRPKPKSKLSPDETEFRAKRARQLAHWKNAHPESPKKAAQHLAAPGAKRAAKKQQPRKAA
jgi:hypothetical protein